MPGSADARGAGTPAGARRALYKLEALRDIAFGAARPRNFEESLRHSLMVVMGTFSVSRGVLFLEEEGEFRARVSRGLPPGIPPVHRSRELLASLRRTRRPVPVGGRTSSTAVGRMVAAIENSVPAMSVRAFCPLVAGKDVIGFLLLGPTLTGVPLTARQRETLGVMASFLSANVANHRALTELSLLNDVLRLQVEENGRLLSGMEEIYLDTIRALAAAIEAKDPYTRGHSERVAKISVSIAEGLRLPYAEVQAIRVASILHDVGKIGTDRAILAKESRLSKAEVRALRRHPRTGFDILSEIRFPYPDVALLARHHHERMDGSGYPDGKRDRQIPLGARIIAVADAFDAMISDRPYRGSLPLIRALGELRGQAHVHFDPGAVRVLFRILRKELADDPPSEGILAPLDNGYSRRAVLAYLENALREMS